MGANVGIFCAVFLLLTQAMGVPAVAPWKKLHVPWKKHHSKGTFFSSLLCHCCLIFFSCFTCLFGFAFLLLSVL